MFRRRMAPVFANIGIPMIFPQVILMALALIPIVAVESWIIGRRLGTSQRETVGKVFAANLVTTIIGVPIAWGLMVGLILATDGGQVFGLTKGPIGSVIGFMINAAWLSPHEDHLFWMIPAAATILLIPSFLISVPLERLVVKSFWSERDAGEIKGAVLMANVWSYVMLFLLGCGWLLISIWSRLRL